MAVAVLSDEGLQNVENLFLLPARQSGNRVEKLACLAHWSAAARRACFGFFQKVFDTDAKNLRQLGDLLGLEGNVVNLPQSVRRLRNAKPPGNFSLAQASGFTRGKRSGREIGSL